MNKLYFNCPYGLIPKNVMKDNSISIGAKGLFAYICAYAGNEGHSFPGRDLITYELNISKDTFTKYMKELKDMKYIHVVQDKEKGKFNHNIYYITPDKLAPCPNFSDTEFSDTEFSDTRNEDTTNNNSTSNKITNNNSNKCAKAKDEVTERIWSLYPVKKGKAVAIKKIPKIIKEIGEEQLIRCIERYKSEFKNNDYTFMKHGNTFFNGAYIDYIDENYQGSKGIEKKNNPSSLNANTNYNYDINSLIKKMQSEV